MLREQEKSRQSANPLPSLSPPSMHVASVFSGLVQPSLPRQLGSSQSVLPLLLSSMPFWHSFSTQGSIGRQPSSSQSSRPSPSLSAPSPQVWGVLSTQTVTNLPCRQLKSSQSTKPLPSLSIRSEQSASVNSLPQQS